MQSDTRFIYTLFIFAALESSLEFGMSLLVPSHLSINFKNQTNYKKYSVPTIYSKLFIPLKIFVYVIRNQLFLRFQRKTCKAFYKFVFRFCILSICLYKSIQIQRNIWYCPTGFQCLVSIKQQRRSLEQIEKYRKSWLQNLRKWQVETKRTNQLIRLSTLPCRELNSAAYAKK